MRVARRRLKREAKGGAGAKSKPPNGDELICELQVSRDELEAQNEQLQAVLAEMQLSRDKYVDLFDCAPIGYLDLDSQGVIVEINMTGAAFLSRRKDQIVGRSFGKFLQSADSPSFLTHLRECAASGEPQTIEFRLQPKKGGARWLQLHTIGTPCAQGKTSGFRTTLTDVSERKDIEAAYDESLQVHRLVVEDVKDYAIFAMDPVSRIKTWNEGARRIFGYTEEEAVGKLASMIFTPEQRAARIDCKEMAIAERAGRAPDERWHVRKNGERFWANGIMTALRDAKGQLVGFSKVLRDETERKIADEERTRLYQTAEQARCEAEAATRAKDQFLAVLSHELRTPLTPVMMGLFGLDRDPELPEKYRSAVAMMKRNVQLEVRLINDLLDMSRIIHNKVELAMEPVDLHECVSAAVEICRTEIESKRLRMTAELKARNIFVRGDAAKLQQVFWNLIKNAVKFTPAEGRLSLCSRDRAGAVEMEIADSGVGIVKKVLPKVFCAFEQGRDKVMREFGGLGLGLAISKATIDAHGGEIRVASAGRNKGAIFTVVLPGGKRAGDAAGAH